MVLSGLVKSSLIDYPGHISAVVFTQGCNFACGFCHNPELIPLGQKGNRGEITEKEFFDFLSDRVGKLEGVVVTGGEPTIQSDLTNFLAHIQKLGFKVKLDTNGSNPDLLADLIEKKLVDYVAMDVKGVWDQYAEISGFSDIEKIKKSIKIIIESGVESEFRTTTLPSFHKISDFANIGKQVRGAKRFTVQGFRPGNTLDPDLASAKSYTRTELRQIAKIMKKNVPEVKIHDNLTK